MAIKVKRFAALSLTLMFLLVCICGIAGTRVLGEEQPTQLEQIEKMKRNGYGWTNAPLVIQKTDPKTKELVETYPGLVTMKQTKTKFRIQIEMLEGWTIMETRIFVGLDDIPLAATKKPVTALFPYRDTFDPPVGYYELLLDPVEDLGIDSFQGRRGENLNIVIYVRARGTGARGQTLVEDAWARGEMENPTPGFPDPKNPNTYPFIEGTSDVCYILYEILDENENDIYRKTVSKNPECETTKAKIEILHYYVQAKRANGEPVELEYEKITEIDAEGNILATELEYRNVVKPLVSVYAEEVPGNYYPDIYTGEMTKVASDIYASVSLDEGQTWKVTNLSRAADRSSFKLGDASLYPGFEFPGEVKKPNVKVQGDNILVAWTSKYARSGSPTYSRTEYLPDLDEDGNKVIDQDGNIVYTDIRDPYYEDDIWGVSGAQRSRDYADEGYSGIEIPYSVVWTCRGFIKQDGTIVWMKPERLTSGRRDAEQVAVASSPAGFSVVWQEDPDGLRPGDGAGPGHGWSGATTNHKTDLWYTYIKMSDFQKIDYDFVSGGDGYTGDEPDKGGGRPKALVPMKLPIRLTDNDSLNTRNMKIADELLVECPDSLIPEELGKVEAGKLFILYKNDLDAYEPPAAESVTLAAADIGILGCDDDGGEGSGKEGSGGGDGSHRYGLELPDLLWRYDADPANPHVLFLDTENKQQAQRYVAITADNRLLDGDTGSSRATIMMQNYTYDGKTSAWLVLAYEESKGTGSGPPEREEGDEGGCGCGGDDDEGSCGSDGEPGSGEGSSRHFPDRGKLIIYHSFDFQKPEVVRAGNILNPQEIEARRDAEGFLDRDEYGNLQDLTLSYLVDKNGEYITDWKGDLMANYENARRPRFIIQSTHLATEGKGSTDKGTVLVSIFKMGTDGKGAAADIVTMRWEASRSQTSAGINPYRWENLVTRPESYFDVNPVTHMVNDETSTIVIPDWQNVSAVTPDDYKVEYTTKGEAYNRIYSWDQSEANLYDYTWEEPGISARAHRGFIRGDFLAIAYTFTPNWRQARNFHDVWDVYIRRSFDGGKTWTTDPAGEGITHWQIQKDLEGNRYVVEYDVGPGEFEPARNISLFKNNREIAIEPRLVGIPGTTNTTITQYILDAVGAYWDAGAGKYVSLTAADIGKSYPLFPEDVQNQNSFWMTYGTEANDEDGNALDLYYSVTADKGETFLTEEEPTYLKDDPTGYYVWNWLAKDRRGIEMEQAESQIRYQPNGAVFYGVWNESSEEGSDAIFRRIFRGQLLGDIVGITTLE